MKTNDTSMAIYEHAEAELLPGENLLWVGQPKNARRSLFGGTNDAKVAMLAAMVGAQVLLVLGGVVFMAASRSTADGTTSGFPLIFVILALIVVLGLAVGIGPLLWSFFKAKNTIYAITDRRVLMIAGRSVQSYGEQDIEFIERKVHRDGTGDIIFKHEHRTGTTYYGSHVFGTRTYSDPIGFFGIADPHEVEALMLDTFRTTGYARKRKDDDDIWESDEDVADFHEEPSSLSGTVE